MIRALRIRHWFPFFLTAGAVACFSPAPASDDDDDDDDDPAADCASDSDCGSGRVCDDGQCVDGGSAGSAGVAGTPGTAGAAGTDGSGGTPTGGAGSGSGGSAGTGSGTPAKFCNRLSRNGEPVSLTLNVDGTTITALTGTCEPANACLGVPSGASVPIALMDGSVTVNSGTFPDIPSSGEILFFAEVSDTSMPSISGLDATGVCASAAPAGTVAKFCNSLARDGQPITLTLDVGGASATALSGTCAPLDGCVSIPSGTDVPMALLEGGVELLGGTFPTIPSGASMLFVTEVDAEGPTIFGGDYPGICANTGGSELPSDLGSAASKGSPETAELRRSRTLRGPSEDARLRELGRYRKLSESIERRVP